MITSPDPTWSPETASDDEVVGLIAAHNEAAHIFEVVAGGRRYLPRWLVVADGCEDATAALARAAGAEVIENPTRQGKASALSMGWKHLLQDPHIEAVLMLDGDGQHATEDIPAFLKAWSRGRSQLLVGQRDLTSPTMPWARRFTNQWMSRVVQELSGVSCPDTQCGFRLASRAFLSSRKWRSTHFELETEMILCLGSCNQAVENIPVRTIYHKEESHIRVWPDFVRWLRLLSERPKRRKTDGDEPALA
jgi:glycosyltransferase involved in cell wall biosynthesis